MIEQAVTLSLPHGIHARPAARIGETARGFEAEVHLLNGDRRGDARSTVALLALGTVFGDEVDLYRRAATTPKPRSLQSSPCSPPTWAKARPSRHRWQQSMRPYCARARSAA